MSIGQRAFPALGKRAIQLALYRPAPRRIPLSDPVKLVSRDYFVVNLGDDNSRWRFLVYGINAQGLDGLWFNDGDEEGIAASIPNAHLASFRPRITQYFKEVEIEYFSFFKFLIWQIISAPRFILTKRRFSVFFFKHRKLVRQDRVTILKLVFDRTVQDGQPVVWVSSPMVMYWLYGPYWHHHPELDQLNRYYNVVLDSLVTSGDLEKRQASYKLMPKALATLAEHEEEDRRHRDQLTQQIILSILTFALVVVGIFQLLK